MPAGLNPAAGLKLFSRWPYVVFMLFLTLTLWTIVDIGNAEPEPEPDTASQKEETGDAEADDSALETADEASATDTAEDAGQDEAADNAKNETEQTPEEEVDVEAESQKLLALFVKLAAAQSEDPDSPETKALEQEFEALRQKLEEASKKQQEKYQNEQQTEAPPVPAIQPQPSQRKNRLTITRPPLPGREQENTASLQEPSPTTAPAKSDDADAGTDRPAAEGDPNQAAADEQSEDGADKDAEDANSVTIKTNNNIVDVDWLLEMIGKELNLNYLYPDGDIPQGKIKLHQYGSIPREALMPLLKSVLSASGYTMVREDPYVKIMKRQNVIKETFLFDPSSDETKNSEESIILKVVDLQYTDFNAVKSFLNNFVPDINVVSQIPNTNSIMVIDYERNMPRILDLIDLIDRPGPEMQLEIIRPQYITTTEAKSRVETLMKTLHSQAGGEVKAAAPEQSQPTPRPRIDPRTKKPVPTPRPQPQPKQATSSPSPKMKVPTVLEDKRNHRLFVIGTEEQINEFKHLLSFYDVPEPNPDAELVTFEVNYVKVKDVIGQINSLFSALNKQGAVTAASSDDQDQKTPTPRPPANRPTPPASKTTAERKSATLPPSQSSEQGPFIMADERMARFFVVGTQDQISQVRDLLAMLDVPTQSDIKLEVMEVKHLMTEDVAQSIGEILKALGGEGEGGVLRNETPRTAPTTSTPRPTPRPAPDRPENREPAVKSTPSSSASYLAVPDGPFIKPDERTRRLYVVGSSAQLQQTRDLLHLLDVPRPETVMMELVEVEWVAIDAVMEQISDLLYKLNEGTAPLPATDTGEQLPVIQRTSTDNAYVMCEPFGPFMMADERTDRIIFIGPRHRIDQALDLLALLDVQVPDAEINIIPVVPKYLQAELAAEQISELLEAMTEQEVDQATGEAGAAAATQTPGTPPRPTPERTSNRPTTRSRTQNRSGSQSGFFKTGAVGPYLFPDPRTNRLLVVGNKEQVQMVLDLMKLLDVDRQLTLKVIQIRNVLTSDVAQQLSELISTLNEQEGTTGSVGTDTGTSRLQDDARSRLTAERNRLGSGRGRRGRTTTGVGGMIQVEPRGPFMLADERTNRLLVVGTDDQIEQVESLLLVLDVPPSGYDQMILEIHQPQYVEAAEVLKILDDLGITQPDPDDMRPRDRARQPQTTGLRPTTEQPRLTAEGEILPGLEEPEIRVAVQESTNRIFIYATEYQHRDIGEIMDHIDIDPNDALGAIQIYSLENREPSTVADMLKELLESEQYETNEDQRVRIPGREGAPIIVPLDDIYAIAVRASSKQHQDIKNIIKQLDKRLPQVLVEAILVTVNESGTFDLGVSLQDGTIFDNLDEEGNPRSDAYRLSGTSPFNIGDITNTGRIVSGSGATLAFFTEEFVYATVEALQTNQNGKVISQPRILVNDNEPGTITSLRSEPTTRTTVTDDSGFASTTFEGYQEAGTTLTITPHISEGGFLQLEIDLSVESFDGTSSGGIPPPKNSNQITTKVTVPNNMVIVLGGLVTQNNGTTVRKVPILGDIPLLGTAFRSVSRSNTKGSLYVFVKAQIARSINEETLEDDFSDLDNMSEEYKIDYMKRSKNFKQLPIIPGVPEEMPPDEVDIDEGILRRSPQ